MARWTASSAAGLTAVEPFILHVPLTYSSIAEKLGQPTASRAVGAAVGRNPISIILPCHRVVGSTGSLTGYAGGLHRKRALLDLEEPAEVAAARLF